MAKGPENFSKGKAQEVVTPVEEQDVSERISDVSLEEGQSQRLMSKFESMLVAFPEPTKFTGEKIEGGEDTSMTALSELTDQLQVYASAIDNKKTSPRYDEQGDFMSAQEVKKAFTLLLHDKGFAPVTIFNVARQHVEPSLQIIQEYSRDINAKKKQLDALDTKNPFAKVLRKDSDIESEIILSEIKNLEQKRNSQQAAQIALLKHILSNPQEYGLIPNAEFKKEKPDLTAQDFMRRLDDGVPFAEIFTVGGRRLTPPQLKTLCNDVLEKSEPLSGKDGKVARDLLFVHCIRPVIDRVYDVSKNTEFNQEQKQEELDMCDSELAELMNMIVNQDGIEIYGSLIYAGELPEGVTEDDIPVDFPLLHHREPPILKEKLKKLKGEAHFNYRLQFHIDRVSKMSEDTIERVLEGFEANDKKLAQSIFSTEGIGTMSQYRRLALVKIILERELGGDFDDALFIDFHAVVTNDLFSRERDLIKEKEALDRKSGTYASEVRGIERRLEKINEELYVAVHSFLDEDSRYGALLNIQGESGGVLQLTFQQGESE